MVVDSGYLLTRDLRSVFEPELVLLFHSPVQLWNMRQMITPNSVFFSTGCTLELPAAAAAAAKSLQLCPTLCNPVDSSPPGSPVPGILQAKPLEWVAMSFSNRITSRTLKIYETQASCYTNKAELLWGGGWSKQRHVVIIPQVIPVCCQGGDTLS